MTPWRFNDGFEIVGVKIKLVVVSGTFLIKGEMNMAYEGGV